jgi:hypothetical protein
MSDGYRVRSRGHLLLEQAMNRGVATIADLGPVPFDEQSVPVTFRQLAHG